MSKEMNSHPCNLYAHALEKTAAQKAAYLQQFPEPSSAYSWSDVWYRLVKEACARLDRPAHEELRLQTKEKLDGCVLNLAGWWIATCEACEPLIRAYRTLAWEFAGEDPDAGDYWQVGQRLERPWGPLPLPMLFENSLPPAILGEGSR